MFVDASAIVGILADEDDAAYLIAKIETTTDPISVSPIVIYEAVIGLARKKMAATPGEGAAIPQAMIDQAQVIVREFLAEIGAEEVTVTSEIGRSAIVAARNFGRVVGHRAQLNFGDCFSYACAQALGAPLLFKGNDFPHTDIDAA